MAWERGRLARYAVGPARYGRAFGLEAYRRSSPIFLAGSLSSNVARVAVQ